MDKDGEIVPEFGSSDREDTVTIVGVSVVLFEDAQMMLNQV